MWKTSLWETEGVPQNWTKPQGLFQNTYTPPAANGSGFYVVVLDRHSLAPISTKNYVTNCSCTSAQTATTVLQMVTDLNALDSNKLVLITTFGKNPFTAQKATSSWTSSRLFWAIYNLGVSPSAFNRLSAPTAPPSPLTPVTQIGKVAPDAQYSMIGYPGARPGMAKMYSSIYEGDTGNLRGVLTRNHAFLYEPTDPAPFDSTVLGANPSPDDLLSNAMSNQIGSAPPVAWPLMDTEGHKKAYAYVSNLLVDPGLLLWFGQSFSLLLRSSSQPMQRYPLLLHKR